MEEYKLKEDFKPKTDGQARYMEAIANNDMTFAIGPAGTGKTVIAVKMAVDLLKQGKINKLILARPALESGEKIGFLPGSAEQKLDPYMRPIYDELDRFLTPEETKKLIARGIIEIAPIGYLRGRTMRKAFVLMDEAQNSTPDQMKMFVTRMGAGSKFVINGDIGQSDLPKGMDSGLKDAQRMLKNVEGIGWVELTGADIVRHPLVVKIVDAYENGKLYK